MMIKEDINEWIYADLAVTGEMGHARQVEGDTIAEW